MLDTPIIPDYSGANVSRIIPSLLGPESWRERIPDWMPSSVAEADQICLLILDGLGWDQLADRVAIAPTLSDMGGGPISSVAPTTTATALSSIATGLTPGEHGLVGYRMFIGGEIMNVLRWAVEGADRSRQRPPSDVQRVPAFLGERVPVISPAELSDTAFTAAHLRGGVPIGYRAASSLPLDIANTLRSGERFVYAYYGGIDKIAHERGLGDYYDAELASVDRMVATICDMLPRGAVLLITADHGQVDVGDRILFPSAELLRSVSTMSGEGRFRWFHSRPGAEATLLAACRSEFSATGWVYAREELLEMGMFGPIVSPQVQRRLGEVAVLARDPVSYFDPADTGPFELVSRHGSMTSAEVYVPLLASAVAD